MEEVNIMEAEKKFQWKTTEEELPPNKTLDALENLLISLKTAKKEFKDQVSMLKQNSVKEEK
tara:strand:+ start:784 stop:969 length:186 start_codon:yes stop_codon:yes gene_type:complete